MGVNVIAILASIFVADVAHKLFKNIYITFWYTILCYVVFDLAMLVGSGFAAFELLSTPIVVAIILGRREST